MLKENKTEVLQSHKVMCNCLAVAIKSLRPFCFKSVILKLIIIH